MSEHSPGVVVSSESLALFVFLPMHHIDKKGKAKPNIFSHVHSRGRSIQRDSVAGTAELVDFAQNFLNAKNDRAWKGVLLANCGDIHNISIYEAGRRSVCVYDTAESDNPAHGELCQTQYVIEEADRNELRAHLFAVFGNGVITPPPQYRNGAVWNGLPPDLQAK